MLRMTVHPMATTALTGLLAGYSSAPAHGSTGIMDFTVTSTSATILVTATTDRCRNAVSSLSPAFVQTRRTMSMETLVPLPMTEPANTIPDFLVVDIPEGAVTQVAAVTPVVQVVIARP